jgi:outer membrane protein assembly factor BamB
LKQRWAHAFGATTPISYPLVASGRVFVTTGGTSASLYALDEASGETLWGPIELGGFLPWAHAAYAMGRVFTVNYGGIVQAFDAASGAQLWAEQMPGPPAFLAPPTVYGRRVFVVGDGTLYAVAGNSGAVLWTAPVGGGSPVVTDTGLYVAYSCFNEAGLDPSTGSLLWHNGGGNCEGGGGAPLVLLGSRLYGGPGSVVESGSGSAVLDAFFSASPIPAGSSSTLFTPSGGQLVARLLATVSTPLWTYSATTVTSAPLVVGNQVVIGSSVGSSNKTGEVDVLDAKSGAVLSKAAVPAPIPTPNEILPSPLTGMAAADNRLFFSAGGTLYAY